MTAIYTILYESASGYSLFDITSNFKSDEMVTMEKLSKYVKLRAFQPFKSSEEALENMLAISEGNLTIELISFLNNNVNKRKDKLGKYSPIF